MFAGMYKVASGIMLENKQQESIAHNLASSQLPGFRREFIVAEGAKNSAAQATGASPGADLAGIDTPKLLIDFTPAPIRQTGRPLDFALEGLGFFAVRTAEGEMLYTRNGSFRLASDGGLVTLDGHQAMGAKGPLKLDPTAVLGRLQVEPDGALRMRTEEGMQEIGRFLVVQFEQPQSLKRVSANYFSSEHGGETDGEDVRLVGRALESANVSPLREMVDMIDSFRRFESAQKILQRLEEALREHQQLPG